MAIAPEELEVDAEIERARALSPRLYVAPEIEGEERARLWPRVWQPVAVLSDLPEVGSFVTVELAGEPLVIVRAEGGLRAFFNVCPHRAGPVARGRGRRRLLVCGYHGWAFSLDGALVRAPECDGCGAGDAKLSPVSVETWGPLVFCAIEPAMPLAELLAGIPEPSPRARRVLSRDYALSANWKVYVDNYLEGYHVPVVHPRLYAELDYASYRTELGPWWSRQHAPLRVLGAESESRVYRPTDGDDDASYHWVFPNLMLNAYQGTLQTNVVLPVAPDRTVVRFEWLADAPPPEGDPRFSELVAFSELVQEEDRAICETVQKNLGSRGAVQGRYVPARETGVHQFHHLYVRTMR